MDAEESGFAPHSPKTDDPPRDFRSLRAVILDRRDRMPKRLVQVADFAIQHPQEIAFGRVAELARQARVQPSTMIRFAQALGYSGFSDLQLVFQSHARDRWPDYNARLEALHDGAHGGDVMGLLDGLVEASCASTRDFRQGVDVQALEQAVARLAAANTIYIVGVRRAFPVAVYLAYALQKLGARCDLVDQLGGLGARQVDLIRADDALLAISFTPYAGETLATVRAAFERGVPVVGITDSPFSPLVQSAHVWLEVAEADYAGFRSLAATFALATTLAVALVSRRAENGA
ncbi:MurR/RpiR family transcriptional regulator [Acidisoma cladoniae]|jgi:DNA-binding MurR/RpiR family transcriptional regulator|uniref:MurR/RpiR family transcriptional regulator n=1 Tax=Acidisoma cladoniae TaxID=3040935 RepID=UPI00255092D0|nr:MurR/RpiR family transcriptional regulator [Acidisoma sp. PAMC 29798]